MPRNPSPYFERVSRGYRGNVATCFHCRLTVAISPAENGDMVFIDHYDVDRYGDRPHETWYGMHGTARSNRIRRIPDAGNAQILIEELCPGTGTEPIPLAWRFPDGTALPRYRYGF